MKITRRQLKTLIKEELNRLNESSRADESNDAGYEDGSSGRDARYLDNMDYMAGWETGNEDYEYDIERGARVAIDTDGDGRSDAEELEDIAKTIRSDATQDPHDDVHTRIGETYSKEQQMPDSWAQILGNCLGDKN